RALPQHHLAERAEMIEPVDDRQEMVAGELTDLAGETYRAIGEQNLGLADPAGMQDDLARRRITRSVFISEAEVERAERDPARLAAPAHMDQALAIRQQALEAGAGLRRCGTFKARAEDEWPRLDGDIGHLSFASNASISR